MNEPIFGVTPTLDTISVSNISRIRPFLLERSEELLPVVEYFCRTIIIIDSHPSTEMTILAPKGSTVYPLDVFSKGESLNPSSFDCRVEKKKIIETDWLGIPNLSLYGVQVRSTFLKPSIRADKMFFVKFSSPVLMDFPSDLSRPLFQWHLGFLIEKRFPILTKIGE